MVKILKYLSLLFTFHMLFVDYLFSIRYLNDPIEAYHGFTLVLDFFMAVLVFGIYLLYLGFKEG